jgi:hypothetical protein
MDRVIEKEAKSKQSENGSIQVVTQENMSKNSENMNQGIREQTVEEQKSDVP